MPMRRPGTSLDYLLGGNEMALEHNKSRCPTRSVKDGPPVNGRCWRKADIRETPTSVKCQQPKW